MMQAQAMMSDSQTGCVNSYFLMCQTKYSHNCLTSELMELIWLIQSIINYNF